MHWAFQDRWDKILRLQAIARGDRNAATFLVSEAFNEAGASIVDVHFFSGVRTVLTFEVAPDRVRALEEALVRAGLELDAPSAAVVASAANAHDVELEGTLSITFAEGDPDLKREVPAVPG